MTTDTIDLTELKDDLLYPRALAARFVNRQPKTLANWKLERKGPAITFIGQRVFYRGRDLRSYIERHRVEFEAPPPAPSRRRPATSS